MKKLLTASDLGRMGAKATNKILTREKRVAAAKKGWRNRRKKNT